MIAAQDYTAGLVAISIVLILVGMPLCIRFLKLPRGSRFLAWLLTLALGAWTVLRYLRRVNHFGQLPAETFWRQTSELLGGVVLVLAGVSLLVLLYRKWIANDLSPEERAPGPEGIRAWLGVENLVCCGLIAWGAWLGYGYSFWAILVLTLGALLAYPLITTVMQSAAPVAAAGEPRADLASERERVLQLLEAGKITADESAQLLNALGETVRAPLAMDGPISQPRKLILIGGVLLLVGFFLPWFALNLGDELGRMTERIGEMVPQGFGMSAPVSFPASIKTGTVRIAGGDINHALGWYVLLLGLGAAALPFARLGFDRATETKIALAALAIGAIVLLYLLTQNFRFASVGIVMATAAYALILAGTLRENHRALGAGV